MATELGVGYISIVPEVSKISPGIAAALKQADPEASKAGKSIGGKLSAGLTTALKGGALTAGAAAGGIIGTAMAKGMGRLTAIENAQQKLSGLGNSAQTVAGVMDNALASVKGTAHGLGEAASTAAGLVAAGIKPGQELEQTLKTVGDTAAIAGRSMQDVGTIFGSIAARGKLQGDDMLQLMSSGVPVLQLLADETGKTSAEISDMVSKGEIDFATFERAMRKGMGGAALEMGNTFQGAMSNFSAALGRLGATGLKPFFDVSKEGLKSATEAVDWLDARIKPASENVAKFLQGEAIPAIKDAGSAVKEFIKSDQGQQLFGEAKDAVLGLVDAGKSLLPVVVSIGTSLGQASAALGLSAWNLFVAALQVAGSAAEALAGPLGTVASLLKEHPGLAMAAVAAYAGFKTLPEGVSFFSKAIEGLQSKTSGLVAGVQAVRPAMSGLSAWSKDSGEKMSKLDIAMQATADNASGVAQKIAQSYVQSSSSLKDMASAHREAGAAAKNAALQTSDGWSAADRIMAQAGHGVAASASSMAGSIKGVAAASMTGLKSAAGSVIDMFGGPWGIALGAAAGAAMALVNANLETQRTQTELAQAARNAADAQNELNAAVAGTTGALNERGLAAATKLASASLTEFTAVGKQLDVTWNPSSWFNTDPLVSFGDRMKMSSQELQAHQEKLRNTTNGYEKLQDALKQTGISQDDLGRVVAEGGADYDRLRSSLLGMGDDGKYAAQQLADSRQQVLDSIQAARELDPAMVGSANAIRALADESSSASDKLAALKEIMDQITGGTLSHDEAEAKLVEDVQQAAESVTELGQKMAELGPIDLDPDGSIDTTTAAGKEAFNTFKELADSMTQAASSGVSVDEIFAQQQPNLDALRDALGLTDGEFQKLMESYGLTREVLGLPLQLAGADTVEQQIAVMQQGLNNLEVGKSVQVTPPDPAVMVALEEIGFKVESLPNGNVQITSTADVAEGELDGLKGKVDEINGLHAEATADLNTDPLQISAENAKAIGAELDDLEVSPEADLIIDKLLQGKDISVGELQVLSGETAIPTADLSRDLLKAGVDQSKLDLADLRDTKTEPNITADNRDAVEKINTVSNLLNLIPGVKTITFIGKKIGEWASGHYEGGMVGLAVGGQVGRPGGYKLPSSGPGTSEIDGFQGVDRQGRPTARVNRGEFVVNDKSTDRYEPALWALNRNDTEGAIRHLEGMQKLADGGIVGSIVSVINKQFPGMSITSTVRPGDSGFHGKGMAVDFSDGADDTPGMQAAAKWFAENYGDQLWQLIHAPGDYNIGDGKPVGDGVGFYGADTMAGHRNHVHLAAQQPLGEPSGAAAGSASGTVDSASTLSLSTSTESASSRSVSWGAADSLWKLASKGIPARRSVELTSSKLDSTAASSALSDGQSGSGWGHDFFVSEISRNAKSHGLPADGAKIGVATAFVESGNPLQMFANNAVPESLSYRHDAVGSDHDSVGLFQQRQEGWGTLAQRMNPYESAGLFFDAMLRKFPDWESMDPGAVAQGVQVSAFPDRYDTQMSAALEAVKNSGVYDQGGWLAHNAAAFNLSGRPEPVLTNRQWGSIEDLVDSIRGLVPPLEKLADTSAAQNTLAEQGKTFGNGYFDKTDIVIDAENGLRETRAQVADDIETVSKAEKNLADARAALAKLEAEGGEMSVANKRKLEDAEEKLREAQNKDISDDKDGKKAAAKAEAIADAEKKLARVREDIAADAEKSGDKHAQDLIKAQENVTRSTQALEDAQYNASLATQTLEAAERTLGAARIQAAADFTKSMGDELAKPFSLLAQFFDEMGRLAGIVEKTRQEVSKLQMQQQTNAVERIKALQDQQIAEWDIIRARADGAVSVAKAEAALDEARKAAALKGSTSIEAMRGALDRFYRTGIFAVEDVAQSVIDNAQAVKAAEWGVKKAQAENALTMLQVAKAQADAQAKVAEATLKQAVAAQYLEAQTAALAQQTAQLYGLTANQATGASKGFGGIQGLISGAGGLLGGIATALAGFAAGGPLGAIPGALMALQGLGSAIKGGIDVAQNKDSIKEAWSGMDTGSKIALVLGGLGGAALTGIGAAASTQYGPDAAVGGAQLGNALMDATIGSLQYGISGSIEKAQRDLEDQISAIQRDADMKNLELELANATREVDFLSAKDKLESEVRYAEMMQQMELADSERLKAALQAAAEVEALRMVSEKTGQAQEAELQKVNATLLAMLDELKQQGTAGGSTSSVSSASSTDYVSSRL